MNNLSLTISAFSKSNQLLYNTTLILNKSAPNFFIADWRNVSTLRFDSKNGSSNHFVVDNIYTTLFPNRTVAPTTSVAPTPSISPSVSHTPATVSPVTEKPTITPQKARMMFVLLILGFVFLILFIILVPCLSYRIRVCRERSMINSRDEVQLSVIGKRHSHNDDEEEEQIQINDSEN